jgi:PilZ domain-containing protein
MATTGQTYTVQAYPSADSTEVRRNGVLHGSYPDRRLEPRGFCALPLALQTGEQEYIGLLRDISQTGMFFYCRFRPAVGREIEVVIRPSVADARVVVRCRCRVVRIEASVPGAATGVGVAIQEYLGEEAQAEAAVADCAEFSS